jgi:hypothetical protein
MVLWNILRTFGIFHDYLVHFMIIYQEKSGNPAQKGDCHHICHYDESKDTEDLLWRINKLLPLLAILGLDPGANPTTFEFSITTPAL